VVKKYRGSGLVSFWARIDEIKAEIEKKRPVLAIYDDYDGGLGISYSQFARYVREHIKGESQGKKEEKPEKSSAKKGRASEEETLQKLKKPFTEKDMF
jgi:hypothetical protein